MSPRPRSRRSGFSLDGDGIEEMDYRETKHFLITRDFLNAPERFFKHLFDTSRDDGTEI